MEQFKVIALLYIFLLLIALGFAFAVSLAFPAVSNYAFAITIALHSISMLLFFIKYTKDEELGETNESH